MRVVSVSLIGLSIGLSSGRVESIHTSWWPFPSLPFSRSNRKEIERKGLIYFAHLHGSSGSSVCSFAKRVANNGTSGVKLAPRQLAKTACNLWDWRKDGKMPTQPLTGCDAVKTLANGEGSSWLFVETALDVKPPCNDIVFATTIREPWARIESLLKQNHRAPAEALELMRGMSPGDSIISPESPVSWTGWPPSIYDPVFQAGVFDNYHIRYFLGADEGRRLPWGSISHEHLRRAKEVLASFDVVAPATQTEEFLRRLSQATSAKNGMEFSNVNDTDDLEKANAHPASAIEEMTSSLGDVAKVRELEQRFRKQNELDWKLYTWVLERWRGERASS